MKHAYQAIAERFVLEDIYSHWDWVATTWTGIDGNTSHSAYVIDFVSDEHAFPDWTVLFFYVTCNDLWFATPLIDVKDPRHNLACRAHKRVRTSLLRSRVLASGVFRHFESN